MAFAKPDLVANAASTLSSKDLAVLEARQKILLPLAEKYRLSRISVDKAAASLGLAPRTIRHLLRNFRQSNNDPLALIGKRAGRPPGIKGLPRETEDIITRAIQKRFASAQKPSLRTIIREIAFQCRQVGTHIPSTKAVRRRIDEFNPTFIRRRREGRLAAQELQAVAGHFPEAEYPLHIVQIDHTKVDVILVDSQHRRELGRPFLTFAIDIYSRCIAGYCLTFEHPSAVSVGLALAHTAQPKYLALQRYGIETDWPLQGKPAILHTDNGADFTSEALRRGCAGHGIRLAHRPVARPWFAGTIERVIGTFMHMVHDEVPGTTFSNIKERGEYRSGEKSALTIEEFEGWLLRAIVQYHGTVHATLGQTPLERLREGLRHHPPITEVKNPKSYLIDFLPIERRQLRRDGLQLHHISYYDPKLDTLIASRQHQRGTLEVRYDPRNLRFVWLQVPGEKNYMEVSYRNLTNPDLSLWEHKEILRELRKRGQSRVDEGLIMRMVGERLQIVEQASLRSKRARKSLQRLTTTGELSGSALPAASKAKRQPIQTEDIKPFDDLEVDW